MRSLQTGLAAAPIKVRIVRSGVAEATANGEKARVKLPSSATKEPTILDGAC